ncbi:hypothetical protein GDO78_009971 [Eleutherodactylus coqui]|uniref:Uncharacterized protein n=1 Tax=Eleutherodactylus coqui TaxID=57060 RepID=A0A8J6FBK0_ELECQ|nr:hypothetical protein GDO78_009971 [Eleutherodactylus coqui]
MMFIGAIWSLVGDHWSKYLLTYTYTHSISHEHKGVGHVGFYGIPISLGSRKSSVHVRTKNSNVLVRFCKLVTKQRCVSVVLDSAVMFVKSVFGYKF